MLQVMVLSGSADNGDAINNQPSILKHPILKYNRELIIKEWILTLQTQNPIN